MIWQLLPMRKQCNPSRKFIGQRLRFIFALRDFGYNIIGERLPQEASTLLKAVLESLGRYRLVLGQPRGRGGRHLSGVGHLMEKDEASFQVAVSFPIACWYPHFCKLESCTHPWPMNQELRTIDAQSRAPTYATRPIHIAAKSWNSAVSMLARVTKRCNGLTAYHAHLLRPEWLSTWSS